MDDRYRLLNRILDKDIEQIKRIEKLKDGEFVNIGNRINAYYINKIQVKSNNYKKGY